MLHHLRILALFFVAFFVLRRVERCTAEESPDVEDNNFDELPRDTLVNHIPPDVLESIMTIFLGLADENHDKTLTENEFRRWFRTLTEQSKKRYLKEEFVELDVNDDQRVTKEECESYLQGRYPLVPLLPEALKERFKQVNFSSDGALSVQQAELFLGQPIRTRNETFNAALTFIQTYGAGDNSSLSLDRFRVLRQELGKQDADFLSTAPSTEELFDEADVNSDEKLDAVELSEIILEDIAERGVIPEESTEEVAEAFLHEMKKSLSGLASTGKITFEEIFSDLPTFSKTAFTHGGEIFSTVEELEWIASLFNETAAAAITELFGGLADDQAYNDTTSSSVAPSSAITSTEASRHDEL